MKVRKQWQAKILALGGLTVLILGFQNCGPQLGDIGDTASTTGTRSRSSSSIAPYSEDTGSNGGAYPSGTGSNQPSSPNPSSTTQQPTATLQPPAPIPPAPVAQPSISNPSPTIQQPATTIGCSDAEITSDGSNKRRVHFAYCYILQRPPEAAAFQSWEAALNAGTFTLRTMILQILHSPEAQTNLGPTTQHFVWWIYQRALHRAPSDSDVTSWSTAIANGQETNNSVMEKVIISNEMSSRLAAYGHY